MADVSINNAVSLINDSIQLTLSLIDDWYTVVPEGVALEEECRLFLCIIKDVVNKPHLPISGMLTQVLQTLNDTNDLIKKFLRRDGRTDRAFMKKAKWKMKRIVIARNYRSTFKGTAQYLENTQKKIKKNLALSAQVNTPTAYSYYSDMVNPKCFLFWKETCGESLHAPSWPIFAETYQQRHDDYWNNDILKRVKNVVCNDGTNATITGYILLTKLCGFPINIDKVPPLDSNIAELVTLNSKTYSKEEFINDMAYEFWTTICGEGAVHASDWSLFMEFYQQQENCDFDTLTLERFRLVAFNGDDTHLTIAGFLRLINTCGFPLELDKLPPALDLGIKGFTKKKEDEEIAEKVNGLITCYFSQEMRDARDAISNWYTGYDKQDRTNEWANIILSNSGKSNEALDENGKLAKKVNIARQKYFYFFQRFKLISDKGEISKEMFEDLDFPGKEKISKFLNYVEPLHKAYFITVDRQAPEDWKSDKSAKLYISLAASIVPVKKSKEKMGQESENQNKTRKSSVFNSSPKKNVIDKVIDKTDKLLNERKSKKDTTTTQPVGSGNLPSANGDPLPNGPTFKGAAKGVLTANRFFNNLEKNGSKDSIVSKNGHKEKSVGENKSNGIHPLTNKLETQSLVENESNGIHPLTNGHLISTKS